MADSNRGDEEPLQDHQEEPSPDSHELTIALYSDPGRTSMWVRRLLNEDQQSWSRGAKLVHQQTLIPFRADQTLDLAATQRWARQDSANITIVITELPRLAGRQPKLAELHFEDDLAVISFPALGPFNVRRALRRELQRCVDALIFDSVNEVRRRRGLTAQVEDDEGRHSYYTTPKGIFPGRTWTTLGMVAANEPFWALGKLSGVFAASAATGAFGVFYSTIWEMATFMPVWRLGLVSLTAVAVVVLWLLLANRLWDRFDAMSGKREPLMYNASTLLSLAVSVATLYASLFCAILLMALLLIDPQFMSETIGEDAGFHHYVHVAWLSASLGTVAGAIGSNFDSRADLRNLTQGSREYQRYPRDEEQS